MSCLAVAVLVSLSACDKTNSPTVVEVVPEPEIVVPDEYEVRAGDYREYDVDMSGGSIEFEITIPEEGRRNDWNKAAIVELYEGDYRGAKDGYSSLLPYKIKACEAKTCKEPRYNIPWGNGTWRKVRFEWDPEGVSANIDGTGVSVAFVKSLGSQVKLVFGNKPGGPTLTGARMKNIEVRGAVKVH